MGLDFTWADALGLVGLVTLLVGFLGNLVGRISATSRLYSWLNMLGSGILAVYSVLIEAWVFFPLEVIWAVAAGVALVRGPKKGAADSA